MEKQVSERAGEHFVQLARHKKLSHAYVLTGDDLTQKRHTTTQVIQALVCLEEEAPCQQCALCDKAAQGQLADVYVLQPDNQTIKVDQIRELKEWLSRSPIEATCKVAIIESADKMNAAASNALLLFLEEPADNAYIFLYANRASQLLPTICSRVQQIEVTSSAQTHYIQWQERGIPLAHTQVLQHLSATSQEEWVATYEEELFESWVKELHYFYTLLAKKDIYAVIIVQTRLKPLLTGHKASDGLDYCAALSNQWLKHLHGVDTSQPSYYVQELMEKVTLSRSEVVKMYHLFVESKQYLQANVNAQFVYEQLALTMCRES